MKLTSKLLALTAAAAIAGTALAQAPQGPGTGPGMMGPGGGPGMMGGYGPGGRGGGPGAQGGYGPGYGMGPGMMGGYGPGYGMGPGMMMGGMMGPGYGMGPGMMGGYGMGPGMMGGYGIGHGMMGGGLASLDLSDAQRSQVNQIMDDVRRKNWELLGKTQDEMAKLRDAYASGKPDRTAILGAYRRISDLRLQRIENGLDAREKLEGVLTKEQRDQLRRWGPWGMMSGTE